MRMAEKEQRQAARDKLIRLLRSKDEAQLRKVAEAVIEMLDPFLKTDIRLEIVVGWKEHPQTSRDRLIVEEVERLVQKGETRQRRWQRRQTARSGQIHCPRDLGKKPEESH